MDSRQADHTSDATGRCVTPTLLTPCGSDARYSSESKNFLKPTGNWAMLLASEWPDNPRAFLVCF